MNCCGVTKNFGKYKLSTKFNEEEIEETFSYFNKYTKNKTLMNFQEFKNSLGVIGSKSYDWVCKRMYDLIRIDNSETVCNIRFLF